MNPNTDRSATFIPFARPVIGDEEQQAVARVLRSGWLTSGPETTHFEAEFAAHAGTRHAVALNSATAGLHLALEASGIDHTSAVALSPYTFAATAAAACYLGATPLFVDIEPDSHNIDSELLARLLQGKGTNRSGHASRPAVRAIIPVHIGGAACAMEAIVELATAYDCRVIEDAAHAQPGIGDGAASGHRGDCAIYSLYATKPITCGEGGMVVTDDKAIADRIRLLRLHGIDRDAWQRSNGDALQSPHYYAIVELGYKYNLSDMAAAIGRVQLRRAAQLHARRHEIAQRYNAMLAECDFLELPPQGGLHAWHLYIVALRPERLSIGRDRFVQLLADAGIGTSLHYVPLHCMPYFQKRFGLRPGDFPRAYQRSQRSISLPMYASLTGEQTIRIVDTIRAIGSQARR